MLSLRIRVCRRICSICLVESTRVSVVYTCPEKFHSLPDEGFCLPDFVDRPTTFTCLRRKRKGRIDIRVRVYKLRYFDICWGERARGKIAISSRVQKVQISST